MKKYTLLIILYLFLLNSNFSQSGYLDVKSEPTNSDIYINNTFKGKTPSLIELNPGNYNLRIEIKGYMPITKQIRIDSDYVLKENTELKKSTKVNSVSAIGNNNLKKEVKNSSIETKMPDPIAQIAGKTTGVIDRNVLLAAGAIIPIMPKEADVVVYYTVESYTFSSLFDGKENIIKVTGNRFDPEVKAALRNTKPNQNILFKDIKVKGPNGEKKTINEISFRIAEKVKEEPTAKAFTVVEKMPEFPGGTAKLLTYLAENLKYPALAKKKGIQGRVFVNFIIETDGSISNIKVLRGIGGGCDEEAIRVIRNMPPWKPGKQRGKSVRVSYNWPIKFTLDR